MKVHLLGLFPPFVAAVAGGLLAIAFVPVMKGGGAEWFGAVGTWLGAGATFYAVISAMRMSLQQIEIQRTLAELETITSDLETLERQNEIFEDVKQSTGMLSLFAESAIVQLRASIRQSPEEIMDFLISSAPIFSRLPESEYGGRATPPEWSDLDWHDREEIALALNKVMLAAKLVPAMAGDENAKREFAINSLQKFFSDEIKIDKIAKDCRDQYLALRTRRVALKESLFARPRSKWPYCSQ